MCAGAAVSRGGAEARGAGAEVSRGVPASARATVSAVGARRVRARAIAAHPAPQPEPETQRQEAQGNLQETQAEGEERREDQHAAG